MKVLKNNFNVSQPDYNPIETYPKKFVCEKCNSELEYEKEDIRIGEYGCAVVDCPLCGYENYLDEEDGINLTMENIEFPTHFHHVSTETGAVDCFNNERIKDCIRKAVNYFRNNPDEYDWDYQTGNLYFNMHRWTGDEEYTVTVSNDYYCTYIPFERRDY